MPEQETTDEKMFEWRTSSAAPVTVGDTTVTPQSKALIVRWPRGGLVWNRPVSVLVERGGRTETISVVDVTRGIQLGLFGLGLFIAMRGMARSIRQKGDDNG